MADSQDRQKANAYAKSKAAKGTSKAPTQGAVTLFNQNATTSVKGFTSLLSSTTSTVPTKRRTPAAKTSVTTTTAKATKQHAQVVAELDHLIEEDLKASTTDQATEKVAIPATSTKSSKAMALEVAQSPVADAQRTVELLTSTTTEKKIDAENKKTCYFKAHARALELAIDRETPGIDLNSACNDANEDLPTLEYEYSTAGAATNRAETAAAKATNKLQQLTPLGKDYTEKGIRNRGCDNTHCYTAERDA